MQNILGFLIVNIYALLIIVVTSVIFFKKDRQKMIEDQTYAKFLITTILVTASGILLGLIVNPDITVSKTLIALSNKLYLIFLALWITLLTFYTFYVSFVKDKGITKSQKIFTIIMIINTILIIFLPIEVVISNQVVVSSGLAIIYTYSIFAIGFIFQIICVISDIKNITNKKYVPIYMLAIFGSIALILQMLFPTLNYLVNPALVFITFVMYHTIENPDVKMIAALNEAKDIAEKANSAKTDFLSSMSHEIRTPLNAIVGFSQALSEENIPGSAKEEINDIVFASQNLLEIVNGILDISKIEANKLEIIGKEYNFKRVFDELIALTKARLGDKPLELRTYCDETIPPVLFGDNVRLKQVILNLLTNSVKYTKHGYVDFKVNCLKKENVCRLIISVEDSGVGIKKEDLEKLFTKFQRFDEKNTTIEGTGLGLAITKKLVELMDGKIVVQSIYGQGSRFTIAIDQKIVEGKVLEDILPKTNNQFQEFDATGKKILVVDDNKLNLKVASRLLMKYNAEIITVDSGFECIDLIQKNQYFDLILMDDMMPKMSGVETLKKLKALENFNIPTVALTANAIEGMRDKYLSEGFDDYLSKPIDKLELNKVIYKFLNKK